MQSAEGQNTGVRTRAALIDSGTMRVLWLNDAASPGSSALSSTPADIPLDEVVPMAEALGVAAALQRVAKSGITEHLQTDLVSMSRGSVAMVVSIYRLPSGELLVLTENAWQMAQRAPGAPAARRSGRHKR